MTILLRRAAVLLVSVAVAFVAAESVAIADVVVIDTLANFKLDTSGAQTVVLQSFATLGDGGGGIFNKKTGLGCGHDDGVVVQTDSGVCYYRQFSGPVHLSWYGVADAAGSACYNNAFAGCDASAALHRAFLAADQKAGLGGDGGVATDGRSIAILSQCSGCSTGIAVNIPTDQYLTCNGPPGGQRDQLPIQPDKPYYTLPHSIVLAPQYYIHRNPNARLSQCIVRPTWYVPQDTADGAPFNIPSKTVGDTVQLIRQFKGTATTCDGGVCAMDRMFIFGFETCDETTNAPYAQLMDLIEECLTDGCARIPAARRPFSHCIDPRTDLSWSGGAKPKG